LIRVLGTHICSVVPRPSFSKGDHDHEDPTLRADIVWESIFFG
jgi:hypothetical protein